MACGHGFRGSRCGRPCRQAARSSSTATSSSTSPRQSRSTLGGVVTADAPEHEGFKKTVDVAERSIVPVDVVLAKLVIARAMPEASPPRPAADHTQAIAATAGAILLVGGGIASFLVAGSAADAGVAQCAALAAPTCDRNQTKVRAFDALALGGWIAGAGLGAVAVWLWTSKPARVGVNGARFQLEGRF